MHLLLLVKGEAQLQPRLMGYRRHRQRQEGLECKVRTPMHLLLVEGEAQLQLISWDGCLNSCYVEDTDEGKVV